ncbi:Carbonic anhydrase or acetyltransferase, isoleucine patch superfamily [Alkalithermobacter thermoalcaliphilus JW-YL-7 = DSM 7308]|uniref:Carbonic anhydrase or acetyltransferase, isoleucine patch superfamily n=1 Tax=Alkalithermobacter thermoalcaliphilus JW-YL-7 = DSM 7308 TaxID=1121328 RepID=A0A150FPA9_CLOPD|nr:transferase hexapeptide repeat containing protein [[Clostridium] paradoxum JW-YL-7 = DSM 7308]SHK52127.1 Carbonic anhydrase or acetyltransferase, isoleucine patch superfamily [[Clostridium] paradoxum JW-YL-7 = DSM 7308]
MIKAYQGVSPVISQTCFVAESADVIGNIKIGENSNIWYNCVIRADVNEVTIGENTNIQDGTVVHVSNENKTEIGSYVTIGHNAIIHACKIGNYSLIGMGAIVLDGAQVGDYTLIGAGSLVPPGKVIPSGVLAYGNPVKVIRELTEEEKKSLEKSAIDYVEYAQKHK